MTSPMENLDLTFWIKNLNNEEYVVNMIPFGPGFGQLTLDFLWSSKNHWYGFIL